MELQDKIGREDVVNKIYTLVDRLQKDANFCLALDGEWGSGKTFVMQMLEQRFREHPEYIVIKYDAWKNNFYSDPLIAILYCLLDGIKEYLYLSPAIPEKIKKGMKKNLQTWGNGLIKALKASEGIVAVLWYAIEGIKNIVTATGNLTNHEKLADFRSYQSLLEEVKEKLNTITKFENYEDRQTKLIILVDEIDRCLPNEQLIVLERVHHLFEVKNCFVIISLNQKSIVSTINTLYGINGFEYLRKFFNLTFKLKTSVEIYFLNMLNDLLAGIAKTHKEIQEFASAARGAYECILHGDRKVIRLINNRDLTQYFENLNQVLVSFDLERITPKYLFFIIIALYIREFISHSFLDFEDIAEHHKIVSSNQNGSSAYIMIYDYCADYLGVDKQNLPDRIKEIYRYAQYDLLTFISYFNEIVIYSTKKISVDNNVRRFSSQPAINVDDCNKLVELIVLYGGESERNATDERQQN